MLIRATPQADSRAHKVLNELVLAALNNSQVVGSVSLLAQAAQEDLLETKAGYLPRVDLSLGYGRGSSSQNDISQYRGSGSKAALNIGGPLYDGGRINALITQRDYLAQAAQLSQLTTAEQIALRTVSFAIDRSRHYKQSQIFEQHSKRLDCLVSMLQGIVAADSGRHSELVQARKTYQEAQLSLQRSLAAKRQVEHRLQRLVGMDLPKLEGMTTVLLDIPVIDEVQDAVLKSPELRILDAQTRAANAYARALAANQRPQLSWSVTQSRANGALDSDTWQAGITLAVPLFQPGARHATDAASRRAQAAQLSHADATSERLTQVSMAWERANDHAQQMSDLDAILQNSDQLRGYTLKQWRNLGRRSLFDVMSAERDYANLRVGHVEALHDRQQTNALLRSLGQGIGPWLRAQDH